MTRSKSKPTLRKPLFDDEAICRFAAAGAGPVGAAPDNDRREHPANKSAPERTLLALQLSPEALTRLKSAAARKGKTIDQIVEKLVTKHLDKH